MIVAVAARSLSAAAAFSARHAPSAVAYGSYEALAEDENVDVAYIGVICPKHCAVTKLMLGKGLFTVELDSIVHGIKFAEFHI